MAEWQKLINVTLGFLKEISRQYKSKPTIVFTEVMVCVVDISQKCWLMEVFGNICCNYIC